MKKVLLMANRDFVLYNFRFELIRKLIENGYEVTICLPYGPKVDLMEAAGARFVPLEVDRRGTRVFKDYKLIGDIRKIFISEKPDLVLLYTTKICIYGGLVAQRLNIHYIESVSGLGTAVNNASAIQPIAISLYRKAVKSSDCVFFQNDFSLQFFHRHRIYARKELMTAGSGVNVEKWKYLEYPDDKSGLHFLFAGRLIKDKGIEDYFNAAKEIKKRYPDACFHVAGPCDGSYMKIISRLENDNVVKYHGEVADIADILKGIHCLIHPSYYPEGVSNVCLEAAVSGRVVITTDNPGCSITVDDGISGYVIEKRNLNMLIDTIEKFIHLSYEEKRQMGVNGRTKICREFDRRDVVSVYMNEIEAIIGVV